jgi:hypothetical protein
MKSLFKVYELDRMLAGNMNCAFDKRNGRYCAADLIDLNGSDVGIELKERFEEHTQYMRAQ